MKRSALLFTVAGALIVLSIGVGARLAATPQSYGFATAGSPVDRRADGLLARMTLDEKIGQMVQVDLRRSRTGPTWRGCRSGRC